MARTEGKDQHIEVVRRALRALVRDDKKSRTYGLKRKSFDDPAGNGRRIDLPVDMHLPFDNTLAHYIMKQMEFAQTFLIADRLGKALEVNLSSEFEDLDLTKHVEHILKALGHRFDGDAPPSDIPPYHPWPHVRIRNVRDELIPFVDFAGFLVVMLNDFIRWKASDDNAVVKAAVAELERAVGFLTSESTYIRDAEVADDENEKAIGWAYAPPAHCYTADEWPSGRNRHIFPTARALVALRRYCDSSIAEKDTVTSIQGLFEPALRWMRRLHRKERFYGSEVDIPPLYTDRLYMTEALLAIPGDLVGSALDYRKFALHAIDSMIEHLSNPELLRLEMESNTRHQVRIDNEMGVAYDDRATLGTSLSTLSQATACLQQWGEEERLLKVTSITSQMAFILQDKSMRNPLGLWPERQVVFHWVLSSVEGLLRYATTGPAEVMTSVVEITSAVRDVLHNEAFQRFLSDALVEQIRERSLRRPPPSEGNNTVN